MKAGLYLVSTPIGNLGDVTLRALDTLRAVDRIACEDTRVTRRLLAAHGIPAPALTAYHAHVEAETGAYLADRIAAGEAVALVSDAGAPLVSDPGARLVADLAARDLPVTVVPGPSAAIAGLQLSGLPSDRFLFAGFTPAKSGERRRMLADLAAVPATLVFFESPRRLAAGLVDMAAVLGDRPAAVVRELTKIHEEVRRGTLAALAAHYEAAGAPRGEVVVVVGPPGAVAEAAPADVETLLREALGRARTRDAAAEVAAATGLPRREVYAIALRLEREDR